MKYVKTLVARWHALERHDVLAILLMAAFVVAILAGSAWLAPIKWAGNGGFGPDWECTYPGRDGPVCIKKLRPSAPAGGG
jgi:hypothetical protein